MGLVSLVILIHRLANPQKSFHSYQVNITPLIVILIFLFSLLSKSHISSKLKEITSICLIFNTKRKSRYIRKQKKCHFYWYSKYESDTRHSLIQ